MKRIIPSILIILLVFAACKKHNDAFEVKIQKTPFTFNHKSPYFKAEGIQVDSTEFTDTTFRYLSKGRIFSLAQLDLSNSNMTLFVKEDRINENWGDIFRLITYSENKKPIDQLNLYRYGLDIDRIEITKDTIFKYLDYGGSVWVKKFIINKEGQFVLAEKEKLHEKE